MTINLEEDGKRLIANWQQRLKNRRYEGFPIIWSESQIIRNAKPWRKFKRWLFRVRRIRFGGPDLGPSRIYLLDLDTMRDNLKGTPAGIEEVSKNGTETPNDVRES